jgi:hypothetical protein
VVVVSGALLPLLLWGPPAVLLLGRLARRDGRRKLDFRTLLRYGGLCLLWFMIVGLFGGLTHGPMSAAGRVVCFMLLVGLTFLLIMGLTRLFWRVPPTARPASCPPIALLRDFLAEHVSPREHARLAGHVDRCPPCQHRLEGLTAGQESWATSARKLAHEPPPAPALRQVMDRLKGDKQEATADQPALTGDRPLGFLDPPQQPGELGRLGRYEIREEVGRGGMGVVLKAFDPSLHRVVAVKVLAPHLASSGVARQRFLREAKAAACVSHDHIVTIHAVDEAGGLPYLVMQYVPGRSLQERLDRDGPPTDLAEIIRIGMQTASALAAAHAHGIVHRDVKPGNILLEEGVQRVKITDFGLARAADDASLTQSGVVAGSPLYMSPEQARGEAVDHRTDLFSLGSVLYTVLTGRPPFRAAGALAVLRRVCDDVPRPVREINPEVPEWLAAVVEKLMAKDPADRFQSAAEVAEVLGRHLLERHGVPAPLPAATGLPTSVTVCPGCGAGLHVPETMVGKTVHCGECGRPFRVDEGSEEMLVALPVRGPFGRPARAAGGWGARLRRLFGGP